MEISKSFTFEASHVLPHHKGKCANLHGHSWVLTVAVSGPVDPHSGFVLDYGDLKKAVQPIVDDLDHAHLGAWKTKTTEIWHAFRDEECSTKAVLWLPRYDDKWNPTSENLLLAIAEQLVKSTIFSWISLNETCTTACKLMWEEWARNRMVQQ